MVKSSYIVQLLFLKDVRRGEGGLAETKKRNGRMKAGRKVGRKGGSKEGRRTEGRKEGRKGRKGMQGWKVGIW